MNNVKNQKFTLSITITNQCNLDCLYCYEKDKNNRKPNRERIKDIIVEYLNSDKYGNIIIDFFGGEPFIAFDEIKEISEWIWSNTWKNNYLLFCTTNGTLIKGKIQEWLKVNKCRFWVSLSLDGNRESHNINRSNSFDNIDLEFFKKCWPTQPIKMTISKETAPMLCENIKFIHSLGFRIAGANFAEGIDWTDINIKDIILKQLELLSLFYIENPNIEPAPLLDMKIELCEFPKEKTKWCGTGEHMAIYDIFGNKYPCSFFTPMTFPKEKLDKIKAIDFSDHDNFIDVKCLENCYIYPICPNCYGANFLSTNSIKDKDKGGCDLVKMRAVFCAAIQANRLINQCDENKIINSLKIKAISKINELYNQ